MSISVHVSVILEPCKQTCGQKVKQTEEKKQKSETDAWTQINTQGNAGNTLFQLANQLFFLQIFSILFNVHT